MAGDHAWSLDFDPYVPLLVIPLHSIAFQLDNHSRPFDRDHSRPPLKPSFAHVVAAFCTNVCTFNLSQLPMPCIKGEEVVVSILEDEYIAGFEACKTNSVLGCSSLRVHNLISSLP